jgi:1-deoxy-D-xylulose-5-phosphate synthase
MEDLEKLAQEIRNFLILNLSRTGGHLAPNLGIVEITLALHKVFSFPRDELIFDVGHQAYVHKILTGRKDLFSTLRKYRGLSGFSHRDESVYDLFTTGHGGASLSSALGKALARDLSGLDHHVIPVIGDGALTEGMALEALNHMGHQKSRVIVVLNDNGMSIAPNVGGFSRYFDKLRSEPHFRSSKEYLKHLVKDIPFYGNRLYTIMSKMKNSFKYLLTPGILFEELGIRYMGPVDGHNIGALVELLNEAKEVTKPVILHLKTTKGKGFTAAEDTTSAGAQWHGGGPFDPVRETFIKKPSPPAYSKIFGQHLASMAEEDEKICAITAAMPDGTGLTPFKERHPSRFFDVAMAEQHGVTLGAGMAHSGLTPFVAIYSTFLQRAFDQIIHDVCLQNLPVRFCLDRAGLVGADGPTHHGVFDYAYLRCLPNLISMAPADEQEFVSMLNTMAAYREGPISVRYPRGSGPGKDISQADQRIEIGKGILIEEGKDLTIVAIGSMVETSRQIVELLKKVGIEAGLINARFVKPLDEEMILEQASRTGKLVTIEEGTVKGGFGSGVLELLHERGVKASVLQVGIPDEFIFHGSVSELYQEVGLDPSTIFETIWKWIQNEVKEE